MIEKIISEMTLEQKVGQINQKLYGWEIYYKENGEIKLTEKFKDHVSRFGTIGSIYGVLRADPWSGRDFDSGLNQFESRKLLKLVSDYICDMTPFKIRPFFMEETPHGHQGLNAIVYPTNIGIAATFNPELYEKSISQLGEYMDYLGVNIGLFSGLDISRNPRWGRTEETFGEDPFLAGRFVEKIGFATKKSNFKPCLKHFAAQGTPYLGINSSPAIIGERELREIHIPPMKSAINSGIRMCMAAYNEIDGIPCHVNKNLLTEILRSELKFNGVVLADGGALDRIVSKNNSVAAVAKISLDAGVDLSLWDNVYDQLIDSVNSGIVPIEYVNNAVRRILKLKESMGLIGSEFYQSDDFDVEEDWALKLAEESIVLIKNDNCLPFTNKKLLVVGENLDDIYISLGDYTSIQNESKQITILEALKSNNEKTQYISFDEVFSKDKKFFKNFERVIIGLGGSSKRNFDAKFESNGAIVVDGNAISMDCGEGCDLADVSINKKQIDVIDYIYNYNKMIIGVSIQGRPYSFGKAIEKMKAIILGYYPGQCTGIAISNVIFGKINPSGKTPVSIVNDSKYSGYTYNHRYNITEQKFVDANDNSIIPFGFGLSYTNFKYNNMNVNIIDNELVIDIEIENTGKYSGKEVVQLYVKKFDSVTTKRQRELIEFKKIYVKKKESETVVFKINTISLETFDINIKTTLEDGYYEFIFGNGEETFISKLIYLTFDNNINTIMGMNINWIFKLNTIF
ncbi:MAG: beta-glucosidase family protein [Mycoplasmatales bacterium]